MTQSNNSVYDVVVEQLIAQGPDAMSPELVHFSGACRIYRLHGFGINRRFYSRKVKDDQE
ncbi:MAG: hypothetical protein ACI9J2_002314 [Saprospiraceae bacterium]|jgi:hypothetical protein